MKRPPRAVCFATTVVLIASIAGCSLLTPPSQEERFLAAIAQCTADDPSTTLCVAVLPLRAGSDSKLAALPRIARNSSLRMHPASSLKLVLAATAIDLGALDPSRQPKVATRLLRERNGTALVLQGGGDPFLSKADLEDLWAQASKEGVVVDDEIRVDSGAFSPPPFGTGWMWDDEPGAYMPYVSALTLASGAVAVKVARDAKPDSDPTIAFDPPAIHHFQLDAALENAPLGANTDVTITREIFGNRRVLHLAGSIAPAGHAETTLSVPDPDLFTADVFGSIADKDRPAAMPLKISRIDPRTADEGSYTEVARVERSYAEILTRMLKTSDNLAAECILRLLPTLAEPQHRQPAVTASEGLQFVSLYITRLGFHPDDFRIVDGCGLSFYDAITADLLVAVLADMGSRDTFESFRAMLPIAGEDGTLAHRFTESPARGHIAAKTGTLAGVSALAGYAESDDGARNAFAILAGQYVGPAANWRARIDALAEQLVVVRPDTDGSNRANAPKRSEGPSP